MSNKPKITIFTPTYNRAHTLFRVYESLKAQSDTRFKWLIIDDGSTDNTRSLVEKWTKEKNKFEIIYYYQENQGMSAAHNAAYRKIDTELCVCIDSDDWLGNEAISVLLTHWENVKDDSTIIGMVGLDATVDGKYLGSPICDINSTTLKELYKYRNVGDRKLIYRSSIMKKIPEYPIFPGEKYIGLAYKYLQADSIGKLSVINKTICIVDYQPDGSSATMFQQYLNNPKGFAELRRLMMKDYSSKVRLVVDCIHYCSSCYIGKIKKPISKSPKKGLTIICFPMGVLLASYIRYKAKQQEQDCSYEKNKNSIPNP